MIKKAKSVKKEKTYIVASIVSLFLILLTLLTITSFTQKKKPAIPQPESKAASACPTTSTQSYSTIAPYKGNNPLQQPVDQNPEVNLSLRGYVEVNEAKELIDVGGDVDRTQPPQFSTIFAGRLPGIAKTYQVYQKKGVETEYEFCTRGGAGYCPKTNLIGFDARPGEPILSPKSGYFGTMVLYANHSSILFTVSTGDNLADGYLIYYDDFCIDPNLLSLYQQSDSGGRNVLPKLEHGSVVGYGNGHDVKMTIRDSGTFMDLRVRKDWFQGIDKLPPAQPDTTSSSPTPIPFISPTIIPTNIVISPTITVIQPTTRNLQPTIFVPSPTTGNVQPTSTTTGLPSFPSAPPTINPSLVPTITLTPTPTKTMIEVIITNPIFTLVQDLSGKIVNFFKTSLP